MLNGGLVFSKLFEYIEIEFFSEAICETIGSVIKIAGEKGRNLEASNFHKEIFFQVNLPSRRTYAKNPFFRDCG